MSGNYEQIFPIGLITNYVEKFWKYENIECKDELISILPDGNFELVFRFDNDKIDTIKIFGLTTKEIAISSNTNNLVYGITFKPLAAEYILKQNLNNILNSDRIIDNDFWDLNTISVNSFEEWVKFISIKINYESKIGKLVDVRKQRLFDFLFLHKGNVNIKALSEYTYWNTRQLNRYFQSRFGISIKTYCNVLRSHANYKRIINGNLSPIEDFYDQSHLIREIKKHTGLNPSELFKNDRFIQFNI